VDSFLSDGVTYLGEKTVENTIGVAELLRGNPDALIDSINDTFADVASAISSLLEYSPLALQSFLLDALPDGAVTDFLKSGQAFLESTQQAIAGGVVEGLNPIKLAETAINDLDEIAGDILKVVENLDDPLNAANEFLKLQQKWTGVGALTYMFTEKDFEAGLKKALLAMNRQVEIVSTYAGGVGGALTPAADVQGAILGHVLEESKGYINSLAPGSPERKTATAYAAIFAVAYKASVLDDPNFDANANVARHPLFLAERRQVELKWLGNDHNTGGKYDFGLQHPVVENKPGCINLGDRIYAGKVKTNTGPAICGVESGRNKWWARPIDYKAVWGSNCAGGSHDLSMFQPVCPSGYVSVGFAAHDTATGTKPQPNAIACLKSDPRIMTVEDGISAGLQWVATDQNSGSKFDGTFYERGFLGIPLLHAIGGTESYKSSADTAFVKSLNVPVPARGTAPSYEKAQCVNFYSEPYFGGWTREECNLDVRRSLVDSRTGSVLQGAGVSSFHCGPEVAGVEVFSGRMGSKTFNCAEGGYLGQWAKFGATVTMLSSYTATNGVMVQSPQTIENVKLQAQKAERDRIARQLVTERAVQFVADSANECNNQNDANSCQNLGLVYSTGTPNIARDLVASTFYLERACRDLGLDSACPTLRNVTVVQGCGNENIPTMCTKAADIYYLRNISGVAEDYPRARRLYDLACNFSDPNYPADPFACRRYGDMQRNGAGGEVDLEGAYVSYLAGCDLNEGYACNSVADFFREGIFVERDLDAARVYYGKTCAVGITEGCGSVTRVINEQFAEEAEAERVRLAAAAIADSDSDGMTDVWERANAFDPFNSADAAEDYDQDGVTNFAEFTQQSDPRDIRPRVTDPGDVVGAGGELIDDGAGGGGDGAGGGGDGAGGGDAGAGGSDAGAGGSDAGAGGSDDSAGGSDDSAGGSDDSAGGSDDGAGGSDAGAGGSDDSTGGSDDGASGSDNSAGVIDDVTAGGGGGGSLSYLILMLLSLHLLVVRHTSLRVRD
jgi:hypothetical protein